MIWKFLKQNVLLPKGLKRVQHWVSRIGLLVMSRGKFASTNQKHYPDLGSDTSLAWNFCARSSDVITQRQPLVTSRNVGCFLRLYTSTILKGRNNNDIHKSTHLSCFLYCLYSRSHGHRQSTIVLDHECMWRFASYYWNIAWRFGFLCTAFFLCKKEKKNIWSCHSKKCSTT